MSSIDKVTLCTRALQLIGEGEYVKDTPGYRACELWFDQVFHELLAAHDWSFARRYVVLEDDEFDCTYELPHDCLRIIEVRGLKHWRKYGTRIHAEDGCVPDGVVELIYTSSSFPNRGELPGNVPEFARALTLRLAAALCPSVAHDPQLRIMLLQEAAVALDLAMTHDTQQDNSNDQHPLARLMGESIINS